MDGREIRGLVLDTLPDRHDAGREAGVLGNDFMDGTITVFDYACHRIEVRPKPADVAAIVGDAGPPIRATRAPGTNFLQFPIVVNGAAGTALLDTGSRVTKLNTSYARRAGVDPASPAFHDAAPLFGASGHPVTPRSGPIGWIAFGGVRMDHVHGQVIDLPVMKEMYGDAPVFWFSADLLTHMRLIYDHQANRLWFRRSRCRG